MFTHSETYGVGVQASLDLSAFGFPASISGTTSRSMTSTNGVTVNLTNGSMGGDLPADRNKKYFIAGFARTELALVESFTDVGTGDIRLVFVKKIGYVGSVSANHAEVLERHWVDPDAAAALGLQAEEPGEPKITAGQPAPLQLPVLQPGRPVPTETTVFHQSLFSDEEEEE
jgi:hypothetical protein